MMAPAVRDELPALSGGPMVGQFPPGAEPERGSMPCLALPNYDRPLAVRSRQFVAAATAAADRSAAHAVAIAHAARARPAGAGGLSAHALCARPKSAAARPPLFDHAAAASAHSRLMHTRRERARTTAAAQGHAGLARCRVMREAAASAPHLHSPRICG